MNTYAHALRRFWWVILIGLVAAAAVAYVMVKNEKASYQSSARLLVTSTDGPYFRTSIRRVEELPQDAGDTSLPRTVTRVVSPDVRTLVQAANLYPLLIESDDVARVREDMFGDLPGTVTAEAIGSTVTVNRFEPGEIPVIQIVGVADRPGQAIELTQSTTEAFVAWMTQQQEAAGIGENERILIQELQVPVRATSAGGQSLALPVLVAAAVVIAFGALAFLLDRVVPRRRRKHDLPPPPRHDSRAPDDRPVEELTAS